MSSTLRCGTWASCSIRSFGAEGSAVDEHFGGDKKSASSAKGWVRPREGSGGERASCQKVPGELPLVAFTDLLGRAKKPNRVSRSASSPATLPLCETKPCARALSRRNPGRRNAGQNKNHGTQDSHVVPHHGTN